MRYSVGELLNNVEINDFILRALQVSSTFIGTTEAGWKYPHKGPNVSPKQISLKQDPIKGT